MNRPARSSDFTVIDLQRHIVEGIDGGGGPTSNSEQIAQAFGRRLMPNVLTVLVLLLRYRLQSC